MVPSDVQPAEPNLDLLYDWEHSLYPPQRKGALLVSVAVHVVVLIAVLLAPPVHVRIQPIPETAVDFRKSTPLVAPRLPRPFELTQKEPNRGKINKEVTLEQLIPQPERVARNTPPPRPFAMPKPVAPAPTVLLPEPEPPALGTQAKLPDIAAPQLPTVEKPKLAFENPGAPSGAPTARGRVQIPKAPSPAIDEAIRTNVRNRPNGSVVITDVMDLPGGAGATLSTTPNQGKAGSSLELLSDPQGIDFKPYLIRVLAAVRRNWFAVIPESAKYGQRGKVMIQFAISREGRVPKLVISLPSGADALDRAAVAGISASNPFPPLPPEFKGDQIRLQLSFLYNVPVN